MEKRVKDLKVGDHVYLMWDYGLDFEDWFTVAEIKKKGTLATIKLAVREGNSIREVIAYGHVSSPILSWFSKGYSFHEYPLTADRESVQRLANAYNMYSEAREIGMTVKKLLKQLTKSI